jgi:hypothetical protein
MQPNFLHTLKDFLWDHHREVIAFVSGLILGLILA